MAKRTRRVALVTGGAIRVGRTIIQRLVEDQFEVAFTYFHSEADAAGLRKWIHRRLGRSGMAIRADLREPQVAAEQVRREFERKFDRLDLLVNNASIYQPARLRETRLPLLQELSAIHLHAPLLLSQQFESLLRRTRGQIINMIDVLAERPWPRYLAYCATKAALANLTLGLARELAPDIRVNGIAPGVVAWPPDYPARERAKYVARVPLRRAGTPEDVADVVHFLLTGTSYITGQIIRVDGGRSIT